MIKKMDGPTIEWTEQATRQLDQAHDYIGSHE
jgi:hypothetical protein